MRLTCAPPVTRGKTYMGGPESRAHHCGIKASPRIIAVAGTVKLSSSVVLMGSDSITVDPRAMAAIVAHEVKLNQEQL